MPLAAVVFLDQLSVVTAQCLWVEVLVGHAPDGLGFGHGCRACGIKA